MQRTRSVPWLAAMLIASALSGFVFSGSVGPRPLQAQTGCGMFNGNLCQLKCNGHCPDGSCCDWSYYYYSTPVGET